MAVTGYPGHEERVLHLRNVNRKIAQTREYLNWRYRQLPGNPPARIAWLESERGEAVGMAAAIFRAFWVNDKLESVAVVGDISLDARLRGRGLGQQLLMGLSHDLVKHTSNHRALVIPTEAARRSLDTLGWRSAGKLIPYVCLLNPSIRLARILRSKFIGSVLGVLAQSTLAILSKLQVRNGFSIHITDDFDSMFDRLWTCLPKAGLIMSDRSFKTLAWRYRDHPNSFFRVARFIYRGELRGYVIFKADLAERECTIQDVVVANESDLPCMLALFLGYCIEQGSVDFIRLVLSECHPYIRKIWRLGFVPRELQGVFQVFDPLLPGSGIIEPWWLTGGDKDI